MLFDAAQSLPPTRVSLICRNPSCGLRRCSMPKEMFIKLSVQCDKCGLPMECFAVCAGRDPLNGETVWSDVIRDPVLESLTQV